MKKYSIIEEPRNEIVVYQPNETVRLEVELHDESAWLTQQKIADLFGVQKAAISKHLRNIFATGELVENQVVSKMETTTQHGAMTGWLCGASVKDAGRCMFALVRMTIKPDFIMNQLPQVQ